MSALTISMSPGVRPCLPVSTRFVVVCRSVTRTVAGPVAAFEVRVPITVPPRTTPTTTASAVPTSFMGVSFRRKDARSLPACVAPRQFDPEDGSLSDRAREGHPAPVGLDHGPREGQPEAAPGDPARGGVAAEELREDARLLVVGD